MRMRRVNRNNVRQISQNRSDTAMVVGFVVGAVVGVAIGVAVAFFLAPLLIGTALAWISAAGILAIAVCLSALLGLEIGERAERAHRFRRALRAHEYQPLPTHAVPTFVIPAPTVLLRENRAQVSRKHLFAPPLASSVECAARERENDQRLQQESKE